jgi:multiple sugar transport system substrate-binding protein
MGDPDVLQIDVVWTAELAAAGWIAPLGPADDVLRVFDPAAAAASQWRDTAYALPWFVDVGLLYRRTDLVPAEPQTMDELISDAGRAMQSPGGPEIGFAFQGARYEGLTTVFLEFLTAYGGGILDRQGRVIVDRPEAVRALQTLRRMVGPQGVSPREALTWHEEESRFAFQNGRAVFMRNWPYAAPLMADSANSRVAGRVAVSPMPRGDSAGRPAATLGGSLLAVNSRSEHPDQARLLVQFLTAPEQMRERAIALGQFPARDELFDDPQVAASLAIPADDARRVIRNAVARPATPVYTELSEILQVAVHRCLSGEQEPDHALREAAEKMRALLARSGLEPADASAR